MNKLIQLFVNDGRFVFRNSILIVLAIAPILVFCFVRFGIPILVENYLPNLPNYFPYIITLFCIIIAVFPAFAISFIMLDEKDEDIFSVIRIMPISFSDFLTYRLSFVFIFGFIFSLLTLKFNGLLEMNFVSCVWMALLPALSGPIITLITVIFASNKIEGLTVLKGINFILVLPLLSAFTPSNWKMIFSVIPQFWTYQTFVELYLNNNMVMSYIIGLGYHFVVLIILVILFKKKIFRTK